MICPQCNKHYENGKFCPDCGVPLVEETPQQQASGISLNLGDANAISGGLHVADSHNVHNEDRSVHNITNTTSTVNNITQVAAQKSEMELLQEKKAIYLTECKRAYEDNVLEQSEVVVLEECRIKLGLDKATADAILESVRVMSERNARKTTLNPIAQTKLKILTDNLKKNEVKALMDQIDGLEPLVRMYDHDELARKYFLVLAALKSEKCIEMKENSKIDSYWKSFWSYLAYIKSGRITDAENVLISLDRFTNYPEDNMSVLAVAGALMMGKTSEAKEYLSAVTGEFTPALQRFVDSIYLLLEPKVAKEMGADENTCAFYLVNFFGQKDPKVKAEEERIRKAKAEEEAKRKAKEAEEARKRAEEERRRIEAERKAKEEAIRKAKEAEEAKRRAEEAKRRAEAEAKRRAEEEARKKAEEAKRRAEEDARRKAKEAEEAKRKAAIKTYNGHECVDLGLPSGTLWATCNIGASKPEEPGNYFSWGETTGYDEGKREFDDEHYKLKTTEKNMLSFLVGSKWIYTKYCDNKEKGKVDNKSSLEKEDDAAHVQWGEGWSIPTEKDFNELRNKDYTECSSFSMNGIKGLLITSKINGHSIFLPVGGVYGLYDANKKYEKDEVHYWSSTLGRQNHLAYSLDFTPGYSYPPLLIDVRREFGMPIRPVYQKK